jgi:hypothetical protein
MCWHRPRGNLKHDIENVGTAWGLLYALSKVNKHANFQPTKAHLNDIFYFLTSPLNDY